MIGKWHLGFCKKAYRPTSRGFDTFFGFYGGQITYYQHMVEKMPSGGYLINDYYSDDKPIFQDSYCGSDFTQEAIKIANQSKNKPFFTYLAYAVPHLPLSASEWWKKQIRMSFPNGGRHLSYEQM